MENKYYTPEIEEFHVGFEFEYRTKDNEPWLKYDDFRVGDICRMQNSIHQYRVKHLDREDIESLGWRITDMHNIEYDKNLMTVYETDTHIMTINNNPEKYDWFAVHSKGDLGRIIIETRIIIKNKSELKKVLKMIGV